MLEHTRRVLEHLELPAADVAFVDQALLARPQTGGVGQLARLHVHEECVPPRRRFALERLEQGAEGVGSRRRAHQVSASVSSIRPVRS